jgi:Zn finger protein HypA/HybF involved in hydrogenase expression
MSDLNHYHCNACDSTLTSDETAEKCPVCESLDIHEVEFDEMGVAKWRIKKHGDDPVAALRG